MEQNRAVSAYSVALCHAVSQSNVKLAEELLKAGAKVNHERSEEGVQNGEDVISCRFTPIIAAVRNGHLEMVKLLLKYNPNLNDHDANRGQLPLVIAARRGYVEIVKTLLAHPGIVVNARDSSGDYSLAPASLEGHYSVVELLVSHGEHSNDEYTEALVLASYHGHTGIMRLFLEHGADGYYQGADTSFLPLFYTLSNGHWDAARLLIRSGISLVRSFELTIRSDEGFDEKFLEWLTEDTSRTIISMKRLQRGQQTGFWNQIRQSWDAIVAALWFHYFSPDHEGDPPCIENTGELPDEEFKMIHKWMVHAVSSLLFLEEANLLLPHLCRVFDPSVALESCELTGKTPLLLALEMFPRQNQREKHYASRGANDLFEWNPNALKIPNPKTQRIPMTCAIVQRVPLLTLQKMVTCKNESWFTAAPKLQDPVTSLPNFLLVAAGEDSYNEADIYAFSRNYLPDMIASLMSPAGVPRRGIKRSLEQI